MREIKFRAWDTGIKRMVEWNMVRRVEINNLASDRMGWEFMQFTGLKNKNGKEIYEGDIVSWEFKETKAKTLKSVVLWSEYLNGFILGDSKDAKEGYNLVSTRQCLIIGNIYENPELMK